MVVMAVGFVECGDFLCPRWHSAPIDGSRRSKAARRDGYWGLVPRGGGGAEAGEWS
jgi:hypothetical protein